MSTKANLTRKQAVDLVGEDAVARVDREACEPTNRVGYNGEIQGDDLTEWRASVACKDKNGDDVVLMAYYYTDNAEDQSMRDADGDGSAIDWEIAGYEID